LYYYCLIVLFAKSTKGIKHLTSKERDEIILPDNMSDVLVDIMLSVGHI